jgi:flagella basal body P-ring formation protein FlgA
MKKVKLAGTVYCTVITCVLVGYYLIATKHSYTALGGSNKMVPVVYFKSDIVKGKVIRQTDIGTMNWSLAKCPGDVIHDPVIVINRTTTNGMRNGQFVRYCDIGISWDPSNDTK